MDRDGELAVETFAHLLVERITIPGEEAHTIIRRAQEAERTERNAAHEYLKANNLLPTEEEWNKASKKRPALPRPPLTRAQVATDMLSIALEAMHPEVTRRHNIDHMRERLHSKLWVRGYSDEEINAFLDTLVERQWREFCKRPRLIRPLDEE
jgi:hypothetical protein